MIKALVILAAGSSLMAGCLDTSTATRGPGPKYALAEMVSNQVRRCWYGAGKKDFTAYAAETDVNPLFKRARILLLPRDNLEAKPILIIEAVNKNSSQATVSAYGPMMNGPQASRITNDLKRWVSGSKACS